MKNTKLLLFALAVLAFVGCDGKEPVRPEEGKKPPVGILWELVGFFDVEKNELIEADRQFLNESNGEMYSRYCETFSCYLVEFYGNRFYQGSHSERYPMFAGKMVRGGFRGGYVIDYAKSTIKITVSNRDLVEDFDDAEKYLSHLKRIQAFELKDSTELKLYYNDHMNYLLFRSLGAINYEN